MSTAPAAAGELLSRRDITPAVAQALVNLARRTTEATIAGQPLDVNRLPLVQTLRSKQNGVHVLLLRQGKIIGNASAEQSSLVGNVSVAARRAVALTDAKNTADMAVLVTVLLQDTPFTHPPLTTLLQSSAGLGVHGLRGEFHGLERFTPPLRPLLRGWDWQQALFDLAERLSPSAPDKDPRSRKEHDRLIKAVLMAPDFHLALVEGVTIASLPGKTEPAILYRLSRYVPITAITAERLRAAILLAQQWYTAHQQPSGLFPYNYNPLTDQTSTRRHLLRETMNIAAVGTLWRYTKDDGVRTMGIKALRQILQQAYLEDPKHGYGYLRLGQEPTTLGAAAAALYAIAQLRADRVDPKLAQTAHRLVAFLQAMRREDGRYELRWPPASDDTGADYYPGEAQLALLAWSHAVKDDSLVAPCLQSMRYYREYFRSTVQKRAFAPYPMIPWHTQANLKLYVSTRRQEVADFVFEMSRLLLTAQQIRSTPGAFIPADDRGRFLTPAKRTMGKPHVSSTAVYLEGLAEALALARALGENRLADQLRRSLLWGARNLLQLQIRDEMDTLIMAKPKRALGGFRTRPSKADVRIDNMQHAVAALVKIATVLRPEDYAITKELRLEE